MQGSRNIAMMKLLQKISAGILLFIGLPIVLIALIEVASPSSSSEDRENALAALVVIGLPPAAVGGWLVWNLYHQHQQALKLLAGEREQLFLQLLKDQQGILTALEWATAARIPFAEAKVYLDEKAVQMNATFEVSDTGGVVYRFPG